MSLEDEVPTEEIVEAEETPEEESSPEENEYETQAREMGWNPDKSALADPDMWVDAKEYVQRAPLYKGMHKLSRENKMLKKMLVDSKKMYEKSENTAKERAMAELKQQYEEAAENRDVKAAVEIHAQMKDLEQEETSRSESKSNPKYEQWREENQWYDKDRTLRAYAKGITQDIVMQKLEESGKDKPEELSAEEVDEVFEEVTKQVKGAFPDKFNNTKKGKPSTVADNAARSNTGAEGKGKGKKHTFKDLPEDARRVAKNFVRQGLYTEDEYMKVYLESGGELRNQE